MEQPELPDSLSSKIQSLYTLEEILVAGAEHIKIRLAKAYNADFSVAEIEEVLADIFNGVLDKEQPLEASFFLPSPRGPQEGGLTREALTGRQPCEVSRPYLEDCTQNFDVSRLLGKGAFGEVFHAVDDKLGVVFAVKRLQMASMLDGGNISGIDELTPSQRSLAVKESARREIEMLTKFRHPNIVKLLGYIAAEGALDPCIIYEYVVRGSLEKMLLDNDSAKGKATFVPG